MSAALAFEDDPRYLGDQVPRFLSAVEGVRTTGPVAGKLIAAAGQTMDPWQQLVLDVSLREQADGRWCSSEVGLIVARQNGKGSLLVARELIGLFVLGERLILHSAHEFKTAADGFRRLLQAIESQPELDALVARKIRSHGQEGIELKDGARIQFIARTQGSGRGFTADLIILDEAYNLTDGQMSALLPTLSAVDNPQIWYTSSAVNQEEHPNGLVLTRVRNRGLAGSDGLAYMEFSADESADLITQVQQANPALGVRIRSDSIERDRKAMSRKTFNVEHLSIGDWPDVDDGEGWRVVKREHWDEQADPYGAILSGTVFSIDLSPDRTSASIAAAGCQEYGDYRVELIDKRAGSAWLVPRLVELQRKWRPLAIVVDPGGPAGSIIAELEAVMPRDVLRLMSTRDVTQATGAFYDAVTERDVESGRGKLWHPAEPQLDAALRGAKKRDVTGGGWAWDRKDWVTDLTPLVAATNALWGYVAKMSEVIDVSESVW